MRDVVSQLHAKTYCGFWCDKNQVGVYVEPHRVIAAFRGTVDVSEMFKDVRFWPVQPPELARCFPNSKARVHRGFWQHVNYSREPVMRAIFEALADGVNDILVTGHSLGAAAATITAALLEALVPRHVSITLITFGSPRPGNEAFADILRGSRRLRHYRVQNRGDPFARMAWWLPFPGYYCHSGHHVWLTVKQSNAEGKVPIVSWLRQGEIKAAAQPINVIYYMMGLRSHGHARSCHFHALGLYALYLCMCLCMYRGMYACMHVYTQTHTYPVHACMHTYLGFITSKGARATRRIFVRPESGCALPYNCASLCHPLSISLSPSTPPPPLPPLSLS